MPRKEVVETWYYQYSELSEEAKKNAIKEVQAWNYESLDPGLITSILQDDLKEFYGIETGTQNGISWSSDPFWVSFSGESARLTSPQFLAQNGPGDLLAQRKVIHALALELSEVYGWDVGIANFSGRKYGGFKSFDIHANEVGDDPESLVLFDRLQEEVKCWGLAICLSLVDTLKAEMDWAASEDNALELIENDELEFSETGKLMHSLCKSNL